VSVLGPLAALDEALLRLVLDLRWGPLTTLMALLSAWWVKGVVIAAAGALADWRRRPRSVPWSALLATAALLLASLASGLLKDAFDRARPALADPLVSLPVDASLPSGHAATAAAAAGVVALLHPRMRLPLAGLVAAIALSRVYLGVHYPSDVLAGAGLGMAIAWLVVALARRVVRARQEDGAVAEAGARAG